jgi:AcrR family transcriptional regulator
MFLAKVFEGASLSNLTRAMRINRLSLSAAFGNKEQLFRKVLDRYMDRLIAWFGRALAAPKAREVVEQIFLGTARMSADPRVPAGCPMVQGALVPAEMRPLGRKWLRDGRQRKLHCVAAFNEQSAKAIFRKTPTQPNWPLT